MILFLKLKNVSATACLRCLRPVLIVGHFHSPPKGKFLLEFSSRSLANTVGKNAKANHSEPWFFFLFNLVYCWQYFLFDLPAEDGLSLLDCSFPSMSMCRWVIDGRDEAAMWRVLFIDKWTGESACVYRFQGYSRRSRGRALEFLKQTAVAKLWSPYVEPELTRCMRFRYRFEGGGRLSVLKHSRG